MVELLQLNEQLAKLRKQKGYLKNLQSKKMWFENRIKQLSFKTPAELQKTGDLDFLNSCKEYVKVLNKELIWLNNKVLQVIQIGNEDDLGRCIINRGTNKILNQKKGDFYFSFAFGNEIVLCFNDKFYILNCTESLWNEVIKLMGNKDIKITEAKRFWLLKSKQFEISNWSNNFNDLRKGNE